MKIKILKSQVDPSAAEDTSLPNTAYLVEYMQDGIVCFDIVVSSKQVDIFDHYYDKYRKDFITMKQANGKVNPKLWVDPTKAQEKKKK